ncbi:MAG: response regulator transcription factor [Chitinophagaceae bacterium]|nr:response regulator transcription factor [Chitinophagaceae bacterium]
MNCVAIDDEDYALQIIANLSARLDFVRLDAVFSNPVEAIAYLNSNVIDLLFLDIRMPDISGIELLRKVNTVPMVIFTTAYPEHAVRGFELNAVDYLLKPFSATRFEQACNKAQTLLDLKKNQPRERGEDIFIRSGYEEIRISLADILYIQSAGNYLQFILKSQKITARLTMADAEELLKDKPFTRIHRSYIVSNRRVERVERTSVTVNGKKLPLASGKTIEGFRL